MVRVPELTATAAAVALRAEAERLRKELRRRSLPLWATLAAVVVLGIAGYVYVNSRIEANAALLRTQIQADCPQNQALGEADIPPSATQFGRDVIRFNRRAYEIKCEGRDGYGPLRPADPDVYRSAPPTPSPTR